MTSQKATIPICQCIKPQFAICTPAAFSDDGLALVKRHRQYVGKFVCYTCGGVSEKTPPSYDHVTGESVIRRLVTLGVVQ